MTVDRSYSEYEAIRTYHDRGMMKWGAFATGELSEEQKKLMEEYAEEEEKGAKFSPLTINNETASDCEEITP
ncbi:hypothetical protein ACI1S3_10330 [Lactococcus garvieae]|uniref:hypothetical protein n=1 Tax=Lactococcus TaxID=1357 RepID=UPI0013FE133E|nr:MULTISPECIES: hypothetical protein [Lactococcus]MDN5629496.1 hypothetical protein [Lactococcus sp.]NHI66585.1 hypothetical protein [Lactococcus petauri]